MARKPCHCAYSSGLTCFLAHDRWWREKNMAYADGKSQLGWAACAQNEVVRLQEKERVMRKIGVEDTNDILCEALAQEAS